MKNLIIIFITLLCFTEANAQWYKVDSKTTENIYDIFFVDENVGYCIGANGTIIKTVNSGENWSDISFNSQDINQIYFINSETGIIVGDNNIYKTTNGGNSFKDISSNFAVNNYDLIGIEISFKDEFGIIRISYLNANNRSNSFYKFYKSFDFGNTWEELDDFNPSYGFFYIINPNIYYLVGFDLKKTTDGGDTWETIPNINFDFPPFRRSFHISSNNLGVAILVYHYDYVSFDLNKNKIVYYSNSSSAYLKEFDFIENKGFYIQHYTGGDKFYKSNDYGLTLNKYGDLGDENAVFNDIDFISENVGFICGENGAIYKTNNGGSLEVAENRKLEKKIKIFPVPTKKLIRLEIPLDIIVDDLQIYTIQGKLIKTFKNSKRQLKVYDLAAGNYLLKIKTDKGIVTKRMIIK